MMEIIVGLAFVVLVVGVLVFLGWKLSKMRVLEVKGKAEPPPDLLSDGDIDELRARDRREEEQ